MKSLFLTIVFSSVLTLSFTSCSSESKKAEAPKAADEKASTAGAKAVSTKSNIAAPKADKATITSTSTGLMTCTHGPDSRSLEIKSPSGGCELTYTKHGEAKSIATAKKGTAFCAGISEKLAKNLSSAGFSCK